MELQRNEQSRQFDNALKIVSLERQAARKAIDDAEKVCKHLQDKIHKGIATPNEIAYYYKFLEFRMQGLANLADIISIFVNKKD